MRFILVLALVFLASFGEGRAQPGEAARVTLIEGSTSTPLVSIYPQTRTLHARRGSNIEQYAVFTARAATTRTTSGDVSFVVLVSSGTQPQGLATLVQLRPSRSDTRTIYIGGGGFELDRGRVISMTFIALEPESNTPDGFTLYRATPTRALSSGEYAVALGDPIAASPYGGVPVSYYDFGVD